MHAKNSKHARLLTVSHAEKKCLKTFVSFVSYECYARSAEYLLRGTFHTGERGTGYELTFRHFLGMNPWGINFAQRGKRKCRSGKADLD